MNAQQLKNSILQMAVQGKLVPQDPNDEPASVLLERIRAEKEKLIKEGKIKKEKNSSIIFRGEDNLPYEKVGKNEPVCIADEVPFEIPDSWEWVRLGSVVFSHGQKKPSSAFSYIDIGSIDNNNQTLNSKENIIDAANAPSRARKIVVSGDILYSTVRPYLHNMCIVDREFEKEPIASTGFAVLACHADLYNEYLFYYLMSPAFDSYANDTENSKGVAYPAINDDRLYKALIPIPPVEEQHRIVDKYISLSPSIIEYGKAENKLISLNTSFPEKLKKSILQQAVMGKLVPQDPSDEPADALLEKIRAEKQALIKAGKLKKDKHESIIYRRDNSHYEKLDGIERCIDEEIPFEIPDSWCWSRLTNLCETIFDIDHNMPKEDPDGIIFLSAKDLLDDGTLNFDTNLKRIGRNDFERLSKKGVPRQGDIIYSRIGARLGKARIVYSKELFLVSYSCCTIRPLDVDTEYMQLLLDGGFVLQQAKDKTQSIGVPDLGMQMIKDFLIPIPPLNEQKRIVSTFMSVDKKLKAL